MCSFVDHSFLFYVSTDSDDCHYEHERVKAVMPLVPQEGLLTFMLLVVNLANTK